MPGERGFWLRFALGSLAIVVTMATATAASGLILFDDAAKEFEPIPELSGATSEALAPDSESGEPYTILLLGSDRRPNLPDERSDTTMLVRLDPDRGVVSLLSLPRDLEVQVPGLGYERLNAAYTEGGPKLTVETVRELTGIRVNDVVDVDFSGFADAVNAIDCVHVDIDREYFVPPEAGFAEIDINAGYQRLCGLKALQFVRFRHTDNDIVRAARQQSFLREARQKIGLRGLVLGGGRDLLDAFAQNTRSTIESGGELRNVARTLFDLRGASVEQIQVVGDLGEERIEVRSGELDRKLRRFLGRGGEQQESDPAVATGKAEARQQQRRRKVRRSAKRLAPADAQLARYARTASRRLGIDAFYPTRLPERSSFDRDSRTYEYEAEGGDREHAYKLVISRPHPQIGTEHYGVSGTTWDDPPILRNPSETREADGRELLLFYAGDRLRLVGWKDDGNSYWVSNSLLLSLSEREMLGIATAIDDA